MPLLTPSPSDATGNVLPYTLKLVLDSCGAETVTAAANCILVKFGH